MILWDDDDDIFETGFELEYPLEDTYPRLEKQEKPCLYMGRPTQKQSVKGCLKWHDFCTFFHINTLGAWVDISW